MTGLIPFGSLLARSFVLHLVFDMPGRLAPAVSLLSMVNLLVIFATMNLLRPGAYICLILPFAALIFCLFKYKERISCKLKTFFSPALVLFLSASVLMFIFLVIKQPIISGWDEFSLWGMGAKLLHMRGSLYTFYPSSMMPTATPPALPCLTYFFGFLENDFCEWLCFFAYDVLMFSLFSVFTRIFGEKRPELTVSLWTIAFILPWFFRITGHMSTMDDMYISTYSDIPMGILFAAGIAFCFFAGKKYSHRLLLSLPLLLFLSFSKDMGLALGCMAVFISFFDSLALGIAGKNGKEPATGFVKNCAVAAGQLAVVRGGYIAWALHLSRAMSFDRAYVDGSSGLGMGQIVIQGIKQLFSPYPEEKFGRVKGLMARAFSGTKVSMAGSCLAVLLICFAITLLAFFIGDRIVKLRCLAYIFSSGVCFVLYYIFHLFLYVYVFKEEAYNLASFDRYMWLVLFGILVGSLLLLSRACRGAGNKFSKNAVIAVAFCFVALFAFFTDEGNLFISYDGRNTSVRRQVERKIDFLGDSIQDGDAIFCIMGEDTGIRWFAYNYLLPDNFLPRQYYYYSPDLEGESYVRQGIKEYRDYFKQNGVTNLLVDASSDYFIEILGGLFDVPMDYIGLDSVAYYKVIYTRDDLRFELIKSGYVTRQ